MWSGCLRFLKQRPRDPHGYRSVTAECTLQLGSAMQFRELRRVLQAIVLAGLPACGLGEGVIGTVGGGSDTDCERTVTKKFDVAEPAEPPVQLRIESCRVDVDACLDLCTML